MKRALASIIPLFIIYLLADQYILSPTYHFEEPKPFSGKVFYNPYKDFDARDWTLGNLHAHTSSWFGLTNGKGDENDVREGYDSMGYGIHLISEYQKISRYGDTGRNYISAYEHGYNLPKSHRLVLGAAKVDWKDYYFPQSLSNKQEIFNRLTSDTGNVVVVNHPAMRLGYNTVDFKFLVNYDCMEVLNSYQVSFNYWDTALSNGKMVSIVGNDDTHNAGNRNAIGKFATLIYAPGRKKEEVMSSLREGRTIGVWIPHKPPIPFGVKIGLLRNSNPALEKLSADSGSFKASFSEKVHDIVLTGQGGRKVLEMKEANSLEYTIRDEDTYLRLSYMTADSIKYFLNPVVRYDGRNIGNRRRISKG